MFQNICNEHNRNDHFKVSVFFFLSPRFVDVCQRKSFDTLYYDLLDTPRV